MRVGQLRVNIADMKSRVLLCGFVMNGLEAAHILTARYYLQFAKGGGAMVIFQSRLLNDTRKI